jgi:hypothetical protein
MVRGGELRLIRALLYDGIRMGLGIELQDEFGGRIDSVADPKNLLGQWLPAHNDRSHPMLASIDPYGDTVFNRLQIERLLSEWVEIETQAQTSEERELVLRIKSLAHRCQDEVHLYLKFVGD